MWPISSAPVLIFLISFLWMPIYVYVLCFLKWEQQANQAIYKYNAVALYKCALNIFKPPRGFQD